MPGICEESGERDLFVHRPSWTLKYNSEYILTPTSRNLKQRSPVLGFLGWQP